MTVLSVISRALRVCGVLGAGRTPKAADADHGLEALQDLVLHLGGYGASYPWVDEVLSGAETISRDDPGALRQVKTAGGAFTITLPRQPRDGARFGVVDVDRSFAMSPLTIAANGMRFDAVLAADQTVSGGSLTTTALSTQGLNKSWMYRADLGAWIPLTDLALAGAMPYPTEFDQSFAFMLAAIIAPEYGVDLSPVQLRHADIGYSRLAARYVEPLPTAVDRALLERRHRISTDDDFDGIFR